jgi:AcrR family transcriptional regulator
MPSQRHISESRQGQLLDAAREAILDVGWSRTTLTDIARRAGVSRMTVYRAWPDMQSLLGDLMTREWTEIVSAAWTGPRDAAGQPTRGAIVQGVVRTMRAVRRNALLLRIIETDPQLLLPYLLDRSGRSQDHVVALLADRISAAQRLGEVRRGSADLLARSVVLAAHGFTLSAHTMLPGARDRRADVRRFDRELGALLERYLAP